MRRFSLWLRDRPVVADLHLAIFLGVLDAFGVAGEQHKVVYLVFSVVLPLPLILRRVTAGGGAGFGVAAASAMVLAVTVYGGYFNGGLGIVLLALFALWGMSGIHVMNGLKNGISFAVSIISVATSSS